MKPMGMTSSAAFSPAAISANTFQETRPRDPSVMPMPRGTAARPAKLSTCIAA